MPLTKGKTSQKFSGETEAKQEGGIMKNEANQEGGHCEKLKCPPCSWMKKYAL